ncbi:hypothetical protein [Streptomyces hainanensis]|uniref:hypothetical protein n=1 Tax=Streptomyces hainanensis TaxID=402648 RepID=UPI001FB715EB|nr:hypothetical protein [Streptomyces hainanensis]
MPSSIYWRRRAAVLLLLALVALLVVWALARGGGGGGDSTDNAGGDGDGGPVESITPGPTPSESLIDERPGGRDESTDDDEDAGDGEDAGAATDGAGGEDGGSNGAEGATDGGGEQGGDAGGSGGGTALDPAGLPACVAADLTLSLRSDSNTYSPDDEPELRLTAQNASGAPCALDLGLDRLTLTLSDSEDNLVWSSAHCPEGAGSAPTAVPAGGTASHAVTWDRRHSSADACDEGPGRAAAPGTYLAEVELAGYEGAQTSFRLEED